MERRNCWKVESDKGAICVEGKEYGTKNYMFSAQIACRYSLIDVLMHLPLSIIIINFVIHGSYDFYYHHSKFDIGMTDLISGI